jgi:formamidopyrimidine-DNA glycosylase
LPELPEVTARQQILDAHAVGKTIKHVRILDKRIVKGSPRTLTRRLSGAKLSRTRRHGKYLFASLAGGGGVGFHFGMTGRLIPMAGRDEPPRHAKMILGFARGALAFRCPRLFGWVGVVDDPDAFIADRKLGPDAMSDELTAERFLAILAGRRGKLKGTLLNQSVIAGLGNLWVDETCFQAGLHPGVSIERLSKARREKVYHTMRRVLTEMIPIGGGEDGQKVPRRYLLAHRGPGGACPSCGGALSCGTYGGRTTWFCRRCQIRPR